MNYIINGLHHKENRHVPFAQYKKYYENLTELHGWSHLNDSIFKLVSLPWLEAFKCLNVKGQDVEVHQFTLGKHVFVLPLYTAG